MKHSILLLIIVVLLCTGCADHKIVEELGFVHTIGYDRITAGEHEGKLLVTVSFPVAESNGLARQTISTIAETSKEAWIFLSRQTDKNLVAGQIRSILIGEELAKEGVKQIIDTLKRDPIIGTRLRISVVKGRANDLMTNKYPYFSELDESIAFLLKKEAKLNTIPDMSLNRFFSDYYDDGIDPMAAYLLIGEAGMISHGVALFQEDRFVKSLDPTTSRILFLVTGDFKRGDLSIKLDDEKTLFSFLSPHRQIGVNVESIDNVQVTMNIEFSGYLLEYQGSRDLSSKEEIFSLERSIAAHLEELVTGVIKQMQEIPADNVGFGQYIRQQLPFDEWKKLNWPEGFSKIDVKPQIKVTILDTGLVY
ncbi:Ger(x)C family spore germination protein [Alkalihalobacillus oceani]|uniref:Ger(X)C family spore germination protein n=1 Tax=Halalkalibacter oceani TaxID=1653776 RepID=A0A9X2DQ86_9BACI|nr:Ger(x)C family spore germination protein [Halalkalibacter oceani]MCM3714135.1 Ger(x)C family spore germination protein [Halalkalibacter oceani]